MDEITKENRIDELLVPMYRRWKQRERYMRFIELANSQRDLFGEDIDGSIDDEKTVSAIVAAAGIKDNANMEATA